MIRSLEDANDWYNAVKELALDMQHLASRCDEPEWEAVMRRDNRLGTRSAAELNKMTEIVLEDLDDLGVLVLFSVFEATVRTQAVTDVDREMEGINHLAIVKAVENLKDAIKNGSFAKVTGAYKKMNTDLTAQVDQIRGFRNWVAHSRRDVPKNRSNPKDAFDRLGRYLRLLADTSSPGDEPSEKLTSPEKPPDT